MIHVRRTPVRRTCTAYMYHSVNTLLLLLLLLLMMMMMMTRGDLYCYVNTTIGQKPNRIHKLPWHEFLLTEDFLI